MPSTPKQNTPLRHSLRYSSIQPEEEEPIIVDHTPLQTSKSTRNSNIPPPRTPETRKRKLDFKSLHNYGFQGPPPVSPKPAPPTKKARVIAIEDSQASSQALSIPDDNEVDENEDILDEKKRQPNAAGKRAWWWKYYLVKTLTTKYDKGKGKIKERVFDEQYDCNICKNFTRKASKLSGATSALSTHIEVNHKRSKDDGINEQGIQTDLAKFVKGKEEKVEFEDAMVNWIIDACQAFTTTENEKFRTMIRSTGYTKEIIRADAISNRIYDRVQATEMDIIDLLERTCSTVAISFDGWSSTNNLSIFAMNGKWAGPDMKIYQVCLDFIEIDGTHSGKNLAQLVYKRCKKLGILHKIISLTGDNERNNDTCARHLHKMMSYIYDDHLDPMPLHDQSMRFKGEQSLIDCMAHVDNLVVKAILRDLGSSTHKDACDFLDRVKHLGWNKITIPGAAGDIAILRIVVLWMNRSPQRIQEWKNMPGVTKIIPYDVDTRWNYTLTMLEIALEHRAALQLWIKDHEELSHLTFDTARWDRLRQIRELLKPFEDHTLYVSRVEPTLHRLPDLYLKLDKLLQSIVKKQGKYTSYDKTLIAAASKGLETFNGYYTAMKENDMYWIACVLDPRVKTKWLQKNHQNADEIINRIKAFLKDAYQPEQQLPDRPLNNKEKIELSMEMDFLQEYGSAITNEDDIERYFNTPQVNFVLNEKECQVKWVLNWWAAHKQEYPLMFAVARDYLPIPGAEVDVERLFNIARDILGLRRMAMSSGTLRALILLKDHMRREVAGQV